MTITGAPPTRVDPKEESKALLKEARRRRRLRWLGGAVIAACVGALIIGFLQGGGAPRRPAVRGALRPALHSPSRPAPRWRREPSSTARKRWPSIRTGTYSSPTRDRTRYWSGFRVAT